MVSIPCTAVSSGRLSLNLFLVRLFISHGEADLLSQSQWECGCALIGASTAIASFAPGVGLTDMRDDAKLLMDSGERLTSDRLRFIPML